MQMMNTPNQNNMGLPPSIVEKVARAAKVSGKPIEEFLKLYLVECMREENEAVESTQPRKPAA